MLRSPTYEPPRTPPRLRRKPHFVLVVNLKQFAALTWEEFKRSAKKEIAIEHAGYDIRVVPELLHLPADAEQYFIVQGREDDPLKWAPFLPMMGDSTYLRATFAEVQRKLILHVIEYELGLRPMLQK